MGNIFFFYSSTTTPNYYYYFTVVSAQGYCWVNNLHYFMINPRLVIDRLHDCRRKFMTRTLSYTYIIWIYTAFRDGMPWIHPDGSLGTQCIWDYPTFKQELFRKKIDTTMDIVKCQGSQDIFSNINRYMRSNLFISRSVARCAQFLNSRTGSHINSATLQLCAELR